MRIIKEGKKPTKEIEMTCDQCGCVFSYERGDVQSVVQYGDTHYWVDCPTCGNRIFVKPYPKY